MLSSVDGVGVGVAVAVGRGRGVGEGMGVSDASGAEDAVGDGDTVEEYVTAAGGRAVLEPAPSWQPVSATLSATTSRKTNRVLRIAYCVLGIAPWFPTTYQLPP